MDSATLHTGVDAANCAASVQQLVFLDSVWTQYLTEARTIPPADVETLAALAAAMNRILTSLSHSAPPLLTLIAGGRTLDLRAGMREAAARLHLSTEDTQRLMKVFEDIGGDQHAADQLRIRLAREIPAASKELDRKIAVIRAGHFVPGDLPSVLGCALGTFVFSLGLIWGNQSLMGLGSEIMRTYCNR